MLFISSCSATRYVPKGQFLLKKNELTLEKTTSNKVKLDKGELMTYIQQRPNKRFLGIGLSLGIYNATDTSKHNGWQLFWRNKIGSPPIIYDSSLTLKSNKEIELYLISKGYFKAKVRDSVSVNSKRKATVHYDITAEEPYYINSLKYNIQNEFLKHIVFQDTSSSLIRSGEQFINETLEQERVRITNYLKDNGFWNFGINAISYMADSTLGNNSVDLTLNIRNQRQYDSVGQEVLKPYSVYRISQITINTSYNPSSKKMVLGLTSDSYDSMYYRGVKIVYDKRLTIRENILLDALRLSPNQFYNQAAIERAAANLRTLNYTSNILFKPVLDTTKISYVSFAGNPNVVVKQKEVECYIQCIPNVKQNFSTEFETSTTADYFSLALSLGYNNHNLFRGAESLNVNFRGAYEFLKIQNQNNSYEFGAGVSLSAPRFWLPLNQDLASLYHRASSKISLSYSIQQRPDYRRILFSGVYGYSWTMKNRARFTINPVDINVIDVPLVNQDFLDNITNPFLRNSYQSQLIAGMSANYYYTTNTDLSSDAFTFNVLSDINGNMFSLISPLFSSPTTDKGESYYKLFGLRFAQYVRMSISVSGRSNLGGSTQLAWRALFAGGYAYGNSNTVPFERLYFAGGSNSMRGWQVRTLGPGSVIYTSFQDNYPNQLGDIHLEANLELRHYFDYGIGLALFFDAGNIWMNADGETRSEARFKFDTFYKQIALNTGFGIRYNIANLMVLRLDWGLKLHNPNMPFGNRWFSNLKLNDTAFHFAIGLPF